MTKKGVYLLILLLMVQCLAAKVSIYEQDVIPNYSKSDRKDVPDEYKWRLSDIFSDIKTWNFEKNKVKEKLKLYDSYVERVNSPKSLLECEELGIEIVESTLKMLKYADLHRDVELGNKLFSKMSVEAYQLFQLYIMKSNALKDKIIAFGEEKILQFVEEEQGLLPFLKGYLKTIRKQAQRPAKEKQEVIDLYTPIFRSASRASYIFKEYEIPKAEVVLSNGKKYILDYPTYLNLLQSSMPDDRRAVVDAYYHSKAKFQRTIASLLAIHMMNNVATAKAHGFDKFLDFQFSKSGMDPAIYYKTIKAVRKNIALLHKYLNLKKKIFGIKVLDSYDRFRPVVRESDKLIPFDRAQTLILESSKITGPEFYGVMKKAFKNRWIDRYSHKGKKDLGYAAEVLGVHPYVLVNFTGTLEDVVVLTHELGHAVNMWLSDQKQHRNNSSVYSELSEAAAFFNEQILVEYMLKNETDSRFKLYILEKNIIRLIGAIFDQTKNAEMELAIYEHIQNGNVPTAEWLGNTYLKIEREYYGQEEGICNISEINKYKWLNMDSLFYNYYYMNYSWGKIASLAFFNSIAKGGKAEQDKYIEFLAAGNSDLPLNIFKKAGVDFSKDTNFNSAFFQLDRLLTQFEGVAKELRLIK